MRIVLLVIALNVGVIQNVISMDLYTKRMDGICDREDTYSLIDDCDLRADIIVPLSDEDTLSLLLSRFTEEELSAQWPEIEPHLDPLLDQTWQNCNNGWVEAPIVYAAKKGLYSFISHVLKRDELIPDQAILDQALHGAVLYNHGEIVKLLLENGANPNGYRMKKNAGSLSTLEASFVDVYGYAASNKPNNALVKLLICNSAQLNGATFEDVLLKWQKCCSEDVGLKALYEKMLLFDTQELSLKQSCILHFVHNDDSAIAQIPVELIHAIRDARQVFHADQLLNLNNHY